MLQGGVGGLAMKVKVGDRWYSAAPGRPILVHLEPMDRENILKMPDTFRRYACFHAAEAMDTEQRKAWMREEGK